MEFALRNLLILIQNQYNGCHRARGEWALYAFFVSTIGLTCFPNPAYKKSSVIYFLANNTSLLTPPSTVKSWDYIRDACTCNDFCAAVGGYCPKHRTFFLTCYHTAVSRYFQVVEVGASASAQGGIFQFIPPSVTAAKGTTVTFRFTGA